MQAIEPVELKLPKMSSRFSAMLAAVYILTTLALTHGAQYGLSENDIYRGRLKQEPTYFVLASRVVRPGQVYKVIVTIFRASLPITVRASIQRNGVELTYTSHECRTRVPETLLMQIPSTSVPGIYKLRVEGNVNGVLGGTAFLNETYLEFSQRSMTIFIQTDRPIYMQGQTVRFRAIPVTTNMKAFSDAVDVYMLDPRGTVMKRWLSRQTNLGAFSLKYQLSLQPLYGNWTIRVVAQGQIEEKNFFVEEYYQTPFEVNVTMPAFFMDTDKYIYGSVVANFTSGVAVRGLLTLRASIESLRPQFKGFSKPPEIEQVINNFDGSAEFKFGTNSLRQMVSQLDKSKVTITAYVGERFLDRTESGFAQAIIFRSNIRLKFLGSSPQVFKPAMPFKAFVVVSFHDGSPLPAWRLANQKIEIRPIINFHGKGSRRLEARYEQMSPTHLGVWEVAIDLLSLLENKAMLEEVYSLTLEASYMDETGERAKAELLAYASYSPSHHHLHVSTSTKDPKVGEYIIFHVRGNYYVEQFSYVIISKGIILISSHEEMTSSIKTFAVTLSPDMAPTATIVVYDVAREGEVVADSVTFPVNGITRNNFTVSLNSRKDKSGDTIEVVVTGRPGTYVGLSAVDKALFNMKTGNELNHGDVLEKMNTFDVTMNGTLTHVWYSRDGGSSQFIHFPSASYGIDINKTFEFAKLIVFTDANITKLPDRCNHSLGYLSCMDGSCYRADKQCDGYNDCVDGSDESGCPYHNDVNLAEFQLYRISRLQRLYENSWLWYDINIGPLGHHIFTVKVPNVPTNWMISAFGMNSVHGFGLLTNAIQYSSARPFYMTVEMPSKCMQGEQVGIRISVFNYMHFEIEVLVILVNSPDYKFVHVESLGVVESYGPRTSYGEHQHLVLIKEGRTAVVYIPIVPTRQGAINITIMAKTQVAKDIVTKTLYVESDGVPQYRHTSLLLDLSQGAYLIKYLDTNVTETPIVTYRQDRLYIFGSNKARISVVGDVIGATFPTMPVNATSLLKKPFWCGEQNMFNFAANLYTLLYMRFTGQRHTDTEKLAFHYLNIGYQRQLSYQKDDGSFSPFRWISEPSVWLTAFCVRIFQKASFQEWENFLYIDPTVISKAVTWLLDHQSPEGAFYETSLYPLDKKMNLTSERPDDPVEYRNISLTANVLISLMEIKGLGGILGAKVSRARWLAQQYLERMLQVIRDFKDPYEIAIVAYALTLSNSVNGEEAFNLLDSHMREASGLRFWAREPILSSRTIIQNNRPYLLPRLPYNYDASNIETTAYALLVHVARQAVIQKEIVEWLNTQRLTDGGWASTQDTIVATQALIEYALQAQHQEVTDVTITIEAPSTPGFIKQLHVGEENLSHLQSIEIPNAWGAIIVKAQGSGLAIVQLSVQYNVDWAHLMTPPPVPAFSLHIKSQFYGRNSSHIRIQSCQSWTHTSESRTSGMAVLDVTIPTGYIIQQQELHAHVLSRTVRNLREARFSERKVLFYFEHLDSLPICVSFTIQRWYPVANMTRYLPVRIYDYYAPERYNETAVDMFNLYVLSVCQVCGSYQCPYCPVFSWSSSLLPRTILLVQCLVLLTVRNLLSRF